jgi:predicted dehydrogenase
MPDRVRLGVVGCGVIGMRHLKAAAQLADVELVAVADAIEGRARKAAEEYGAKKTYREDTALVGDPEVEAVVLAVAAGDRRESPFQALRLGKHVLLEKPPAMNAPMIREMIAARGKAVVGSCSCRFQSFEATQVAAEFFRTGALGPIRRIHCRVLEAAGKPPASPPPPWRLSKDRNAGGVLVNWGSYDLDYLLAITGWSVVPKLALGQTWNVPPQFESHIAPESDAETHYAALVLCEDGVVLTLERGESVAARDEAAWQIVGTQGTLQLHMVAGDESKLVQYDGTSTDEGVLVPKVVWEGQYDWMSQHSFPVTDFVGAIREGRQPATSLEHALVIHQIIDAIYASAASGRAVEILQANSRGTEVTHEG